MALIERLTPLGNLYPDGQSTFVVLVQLFRRLAENRDDRDKEQRKSWQYDDQTTLNRATSVATNAANNAHAAAVSAASADATAKADAARNYAVGHASTVAENARTDARAYTDASFAATGPGGATDGQVDAAVDRAITGGRLGPTTPIQVGVGVIGFQTFSVSHVAPGVIILAAE